MKNRIFSLSLILAMILSVFPQSMVFASDNDTDVAYLFAYFTGNNPDQEKMFYGISTDGYNFNALNGGNPVYSNPLGTECLRDPFIFEGEDGYFYALATDMKSSLGWASNRSIITMKSSDLINWETHLIPVTTLFSSMSNADRVWAPQAIYDPEKDSYMIYLAIRTNDGTENGPKTVMYRCWTDDFVTITEPELFFAPSDGYSAIDGDIIYSEEDNLYYMYYKNESTAHLSIATASSLGGEFTETDILLPAKNSAGNDVGVEGPAIYKLIDEDKYNIIYDAYGDGFFIMTETTDHKNFTQLSQSSYSFDFTPRHGYVITINQSEYDRLMNEYGADQTIRPNPSNASPFNNGEFEGWGTSMGWWGNRIGYSDKLAKDSARLFYDEEGLGLDIVRYNVGGGDDPTHNHVERSDSKIPCFMNEDGTYDWDADYNQVNVLKQIKAENPNVHIEGYTNSPPWFMTNSGCSSGGVDAAENLDPSKYGEFAEFIANVTEHFEEIGLKFDSYSPMNEPNPKTKYWGAFSPKQEGNHVAPGENQSNLILALSNEYDSRGIDTLVVGLDETSIDYSIDSFNALSDEAKAALDRLDTHSYSGSKREQLKQTAIDGGKNLWMSEVDNGKTAGTNPGNMGMAFDLAYRILADMNGMQPSAWVMWDILDFHKDSTFQDPYGNYTEAENYINQNGGLWGVGMVNHDTQEIELTQKYYAYGQFTKFIKPGMTIISSSDTSLAAYDRNTNEIVIVALNSSGKDMITKFDLRDFVNVGTQARVIRTSGNMDGGEHWAELKPINVSDKVFYTTLKSNSITTFVIEGKDASISRFDTSAENVKYNYTIKDSLKTFDTYFAIYNPDGTLKTITKNEASGNIKGDFTNCSAKLFVWNNMNSKAEVLDQVSEADADYISINGSTSIVTGIEYKYLANVGTAYSDTDITWSLSDPELAQISDDGTLIAQKGGILTLTATAPALGISTSIEIDILDSSGYVTIKNKNSGLVLDTKSRGVTSGTRLMQWAYEGKDTSNWQIVGTSDGFFNLVNRNNNLLLANDNETLVITDQIPGTDDNAKWEMINHSGYYEIRNQGSSKKSLNVSGVSVANGGDVILYPFAGAANELWTLEPVTGDVTHVDPPTAEDYAQKYEGTEYTFISNVDSVTNNFSDDLKGFVTSGFAGLGTDGDGEPVLMPQNALRNVGNAARAGNTTLTLQTPVTCDSSQIINLSFDMFTPDSNGNSDFVLSSSDGTELVKISATDYGNSYALTIGGNILESNGDATTYFKNNATGSVSYIKNAGHVEVYFIPSTGEITVTLINSTKTAALKTYSGNVSANKNIGKVYFEGTYTAWNKQMLVDNLVTNIITKN